MFLSAEYEFVDINNARILRVPSSLFSLFVDEFRNFCAASFLPFWSSFLSFHNVITSLSETFRRSRMPQIAPTRRLRYVRKIARRRSFALFFLLFWFFFLASSSSEFSYSDAIISRRNALFLDDASSLIFLFYAAQLKRISRYIICNRIMRLFFYLF